MSLKGVELAESYALELLPLDTGIEIECDQARSYQPHIFEKIPGMVEVNSDTGEQRYRFTSGLKGFMACFQLCHTLCKHSLLNPKSGIHYHVGGFEDTFVDLNHSFFRRTEEWALPMLDEWNYKGRFNSRAVGFGHNWIRFNSGWKTMEVRIGEMTFDYWLMIQRIVDVHAIGVRVRAELEDADIQIIIKRLERELIPDQMPLLGAEEVTQVVQSRRIRI